MVMINPFGKGRRPERVDKLGLRKFDLESLLDIYDQYIAARKPLDEQILPELPVLHPVEIEAFCEYITPLPKYASAGFMTRLVQTSYDNGNNGFVVPKEFADSFGLRLKGEKDRPLEMKVKGRVDASWGAASEYCRFVIEGDSMSMLGMDSKHCRFEIKGSAGPHCGLLSYGCEYHIKGNAGVRCGFNAEDCSYFVLGNALDDLGRSSKSCDYHVRGSVKSWGLHSKGCEFDFRVSLVRCLENAYDNWRRRNDKFSIKPI